MIGSRFGPCDILSPAAARQLTGTYQTVLRPSTFCPRSSMDRASGFEPEGWGFDPLRGYRSTSSVLAVPRHSPHALDTPGKEFRWFISHGHVQWMERRCLIDVEECIVAGW